MLRFEFEHRIAYTVQARTSQLYWFQSFVLHNPYSLQLLKLSITDDKIR